MNGGINVLRKAGFTIVELLVVIVVIGILAAITIVSYSGITTKAISTALQSDLINASNQLKIYQIDNGVFPTNIDCSINPADGSICLKASSNNGYAILQADNSSAPQTFCITAINNGIKYRITDNSRPELGTCNNVMTDGLVAYYSFNGDAKDYSGNGNDGIVNGATLVDGVVGQAYSFDGVNDYISFPSAVSSVLHGGSEASIEFWCKKNAVQYGFVQLSGFANTNGNLYPYDTTTKVYLDTFKTNRLGPITMPTSVLDLHHFAITTTPGVNGWKLYQNGVLVYQATGEATVSTNYLNFEIGRNSTNRYANGLFDEVRIYNRALSASEINTLYSLGL